MKFWKIGVILLPLIVAAVIIAEEPLLPQATQGVANLQEQLVESNDLTRIKGEANVVRANTTSISTATARPWSGVAATTDANFPCSAIIAVAGDANTIVVQKHWDANMRICVLGLYMAGATANGTVVVQDGNGTIGSGTMPLMGGGVADPNYGAGPTSILWPVVPHDGVPWMTCSRGKPLHICSVDVTVSGRIVYCYKP